MKTFSVVLAVVVFVLFFPAAVSADTPGLFNPQAHLDNSRLVAR